MWNDNRLVGRDELDSPSLLSPHSERLSSTTRGGIADRHRSIAGVASGVSNCGFISEGS
jgi:hypothetical protein